MATILTCYYRPKPGGFCKRFFRAIDALLAQGHTVHYLAIQPFPIHHDNCHFHRFPWPASWPNRLFFWTWFHFMAPLYLLIIGTHIRCTHLFAFGSTYTLLLKPLRIIHKIPLSAFIRADILENHALTKQKQWIIKLEHTLEYLSLINIRCYAVSNSLASKIMRRHHFSRKLDIEVFPNDLPAPSPLTITTMQTHPNSVHLACVGMLEPRKNLELVLHTAALLPTSIVLDVYGTGPDLQTLSDLAKQLNISDRVFFHGWIHDNQFWQHIDLLLMPSRHEGAPNAVLEALSFGIPVLASDIPEHREVLPIDCLIQLDNPQLWAQTINSIIYTPEIRSNILKKQQEHATRFRFNWNKMITEIITCGNKEL